MYYLLGVVNVITVVLSYWIFVLPLHPRQGTSHWFWVAATLAAMGALEPVSGYALNHHLAVITVSAVEVVRILILGWMACHICQLSGMGGIYTAIWGVLVSEMLHELPLIILRTPALERGQAVLARQRTDVFFRRLQVSHIMLQRTVIVNRETTAMSGIGSRAGEGIRVTDGSLGEWTGNGDFFLVYFLLRAALTFAGLLFCAKTIARSMPSNGTYKIGRRQFTSAITLGLIHLVVYSYLMSTDWMRNLSWPYIIILLLAQGYALTILYVQTELFKKSAMKKEMEAINALLYKRKQQYDIARQNVQLINRRVHDLKLLVASLEKDDQDEQTKEVLRKVQNAAAIYSSVIKTGNDVLDTVLTDKSLVCEAKGIKISAVADGPGMAFLETVDIYTIFNNILDEAIQQVSQFQDKEKRTIDLIIYRKEQFLIINIFHPIFGAVKFRDGLPVPRNSAETYHNYDLQAVREVLRHYDGLLNCEEKNGIFTYRIVIPAV